MSEEYRIKLVGHQSIIVDNTYSTVSSSTLAIETDMVLAFLGQCRFYVIKVISECITVVILKHGYKFFDTSIDR